MPIHIPRKRIPLICILHIFITDLKILEEMILKYGQNMTRQLFVYPYTSEWVIKEFKSFWRQTFCVNRKYTRRGILHKYSLQLSSETPYFPRLSISKKLENLYPEKNLHKATDLTHF